MFNFFRLNSKNENGAVAPASRESTLLIGRHVIADGWNNGWDSSWEFFRFDPATMKLVSCSNFVADSRADAQATVQFLDREIELALGIIRPPAITTQMLDDPSQSSLSAMFLEECCEISLDYFVEVSQLNLAYEAWEKKNGLQLEQSKIRALIATLHCRGFSQVDFRHEDQLHKVRVWRGLRLKEVCEACQGKCVLNFQPPEGGITLKTCEKCGGTGKRPSAT